MIYWDMEEQADKALGKTSKADLSLASPQRVLIFMSLIAVAALAAIWWLPHGSALWFGIPRIVFALSIAFLWLSLLPVFGYYFLFAPWSAQVDAEVTE